VFNNGFLIKSGKKIDKVNPMEYIGKNDRRLLKMKVTITLDDDLMQRVDAYSDENYMSRSGLISFACTQFSECSGCI
jgi:hypothetical protein